MTVKEAKDILQTMPDDEPIVLLIDVASYGAKNDIGSFVLAEAEGIFRSEGDNSVIFAHASKENLDKLKG